ncbi:hypothetical protein GCM10009850_012090 [Nonomuraea monospora]|uniref:Uncharacterized protein n=1 Tax=Nonomuraea monospora TaxID=568818 RepID=A0ABP5P1V8_9ACTN
MHEDGGVAEDLVAGPEAADVGQQSDGHRITTQHDPPHERAAQRTACAAPTESAPGPDDMGGLLLFRIELCGDRTAGPMIRRFQFSYVISHVGLLYRVIRKKDHSSQTSRSPALSPRLPLTTSTLTVIIEPRTQTQNETNVWPILAIPGFGDHCRFWASVCVL